MWRERPASPSRTGFHLRTAWWFAFWCVVAAVVGCQRDDAVSLAVEVRDSTGVARIIVPAAYVDRLRVWHLVEPPLARFGSEGPNPLFRVSDAARLGDGTIVVANSGSAQLIFYDRHGRFVRSAGGNGDGPGEFRLLIGVWRVRADSLAAFDWSTGRISVFDSSGDLGRTFTPAAPPGMTHRGLIGFLGDSAPVLWYGKTVSPIGRRTGVYVDSVSLLRYSPDGRTADTLGRFPERPWYVWSDGGRSASFPLPFGWSIHGAVRGGTIYVGTGERYEISRLDERGALLGVTRVRIANPRVSDDDRRDDRARRLSKDGGAPYTRDMTDGIPYPSEKPAFTTLLVDRSGNVWVRSPQASPGMVGRWMIFAPDGRPVARLETPAQGGVLDIADVLVGVWQDNQEVETIRLYTIDRTVLDGNSEERRSP